MEIFKDIYGFEGLYQVSNFGNIKSLPKSGGNAYKEKLLKKEKIKEKHTTYERVTLSKDGKTARYSVHRLVAKAFIENTLDKPHINHIDNNGENNNVYNLEWCTHSENMIHAYKQGRLPKQVKENAEEFTKLKKESTEKRFKLLLKDKFINMIHTDKRVYVEYLCSSCNKYCKTRTDSALFLKSLTICNSCSRKK